MSKVPEDVLSEFSPTGTLRAAINLGNPVLVQKDGATGKISGVTVDLANELARRIGCPLEFIQYDAAGTVVEALRQSAWDIAFLAVEPVREREIGFTSPYVLIEGTYMVRSDSPLKEVGDVDRPGVRIAVGPNAAYDLFLSRTLRHATLVRAETGGGAAVIDLFLRQGLDAAAGIRQPLVEFARTHPELRVMDGRFMEIRQAMCVPLGRPGAQSYLRGFVEEMKETGLVADALRRSGQLDATVAPLDKR